MKAFASAAKTSKGKMMSEARKNGCHNLPRPTAETSYVAQSGWRNSYSQWHQAPTREPVHVSVKHAMTTECQYTKTTPDVACNGCEWQVKKP